MTTVRLQNGAMPNIQIKNVPAETHAVLTQRAAQAHQSLQEYLWQMLVEEAARPTLAEVLDEARQNATAPLTMAEIVEQIRSDRDSR